MIKDRVFQLSDVVRETGFAIHSFLGPGHLEKVYENALVHRLRKSGYVVEQQVRLGVVDEDGTPLGEFYADVLVESCLLVKLKAASEIAPIHVAQLLGYLRASEIEHGLVINFGATRFEIKMMGMSKRPSAR